MVRIAHIELTNADSTFSAWLSALLELIPTWSLSERKRALALATSQKVGHLAVIKLSLLLDTLNQGSVALVECLSILLLGLLGS